MEQNDAPERHVGLPEFDDAELFANDEWRKRDKCFGSGIAGNARLLISSCRYVMMDAMANGSIDMREDSAASASKRSSLDIVLLFSTLMFALALIAGQIWASDNKSCVTFLGCGSGFFGYDALEHFLWGLLVVAFGIAIGNKFPSHNIFHNGSLWKNILLLLGLLALVSVGWELLEYSRDHILTRFAFFNKLAFLKPYSLAQPSNVDTMGDLMFDLLGGILGIVILNTNVRMHMNATNNTKTHHE